MVNPCIWFLKKKSTCVLLCVDPCASMNIPESQWQQPSLRGSPQEGGGSALMSGHSFSFDSLLCCVHLDTGWLLFEICKAYFSKTKCVKIDILCNCIPQCGFAFDRILISLPLESQGVQEVVVHDWLENGLDHNRVSPLLCRTETEMSFWLHIWCDCVVVLIFICMPTIYIC